MGDEIIKVARIELMNFNLNLPQLQPGFAHDPIAILYALVGVMGVVLLGFQFWKSRRREDGPGECKGKTGQCLSQR